jgi:hypothetical protein
MFEKVEIPTKTKTAFTREYNKTHKGAGGGLIKGKKRGRSEIDSDSDEEDEEEELENGLEDELGVLEI